MGSMERVNVLAKQVLSQLSYTPSREGVHHLSLLNGSQVDRKRCPTGAETVA
jgi:hypothetical protein